MSAPRAPVSPGRCQAAPRPRRGGTAPPARGSTMRTRWSPWTRMRSVPSGTLIILWTTATVPTEYRSFQPGGSASVLRTVTSASSPLARDDVVDQPDRALLADGERRHRFREDDGLLQRQDRQPWLVRALGGRGRAHAFPRTTIATVRPRETRFAIGSVTRSIPASYVADADAATTSWPSGMRRSKRPYSISACW